MHGGFKVIMDVVVASPYVINTEYLEEISCKKFQCYFVANFMKHPVAQSRHSTLKSDEKYVLDHIEKFEAKQPVNLSRKLAEIEFTDDTIIITEKSAEVRVNKIKTMPHYKSLKFLLYYQLCKIKTTTSVNVQSVRNSSKVLLKYQQQDGQEWITIIEMPSNSEVIVCSFLSV